MNWKLQAEDQEKDLSVFACPNCQTIERFVTSSLYHGQKAHCTNCRALLTVNLLKAVVARVEPGPNKDTMLIRCTKCRKDKESTCFHRHQRDGYSQPCKDCKRDLRNQLPEGKTLAQKAARSRWKQTEAGKLASRQSVKRWEAKPENRQKRKQWKRNNPDRVFAHYTKYNHSEKGRLVQERREQRRYYLKRLAKALTAIAEESLNGRRQGSD